MGHDVLTLGDVGLDAYRDEPAPRPGGCALNVAVHLAAAGAGRVGVVAPLGAEDGAALPGLAAALGVDGALLRLLPGRTPCQEIEVLPDGERRFHTYTPGVLAGWTPAPELEPALVAARLVYLPVWALTLPLLRWAWERRAGPVAVDVMNLSDVPLELAEEALGRAEVVFCGLSRDQHGPAIERLLGAAGRPGAGALVVTLGPGGALARRGAQTAEVRAAPVPGGRVVDTTGCGDAFAAAFLTARAQGAALEAALLAGTRRAAGVAAHRGGFRGPPASEPDSAAGAAANGHPG